MSTAPAVSFNVGRLLLFIGCIALGILAWELPVLWPLKLLAVLGHETGHAVATWLVGGSVTRVSIASNESGQCLSQLPQTFFGLVAVYSGGYVGSAVISAVLLLVTFRFNAQRVLLWAACGWLLLMGVLYARDFFTLGFCAGMAVLFGVAARYFAPGVQGAINVFLATFTALYAVMDLKDDLWNSAVRSQSDAQLLANVTHVPALFSAAVWSLLSVAIVVWGLYLSLRHKAVPARGL
ncbi:MAG: M50 family metallopeptidase [Myxococcaceae bacterium]|nr:M50 family metallopeptidase [Myxococcaceae bacterium]